jgi:tetrahydromethanopterin S-methyltransferase subunit G
MLPGTMEAMRQSWTDGRLDDLNLKVDRGFAQVERRFEAVDKRFEEVDRRLEKVNDEFVAVRREMKEGFESMHRTMIQIFVGTVTFMAAGFALIASQL